MVVSVTMLLWQVPGVPPYVPLNAGPHVYMITSLSTNNYCLLLCLVRVATTAAAAWLGSTLMSSHHLTYKPQMSEFHKCLCPVKN